MWIIPYGPQSIRCNFLSHGPAICWSHQRCRSFPSPPSHPAPRAALPGPALTGHLSIFNFSASGRGGDAARRGAASRGAARRSRKACCIYKAALVVLLPRVAWHHHHHHHLQHQQRYYYTCYACDSNSVPELTGSWMLFNGS